MSVKCPDCGNPDLREKTEFYRACCHVQYLIDDSLFCYDCQLEAVKNLLDNPRKSCDDCSGTPTCPNSDAPWRAMQKNYYTRTSKQDDQREDWPHAMPVPEGVWLTTRLSRPIKAQRN